jgi:hypothetical protein
MADFRLAVSVDDGDIKLREKETVPSEVTLTLPTKYADAVARGQLMQIRLADVPDLEELRPNTTYERLLAVVEPASLLSLPHARVEPPQVNLRFTIALQTREIDVASVPIVPGDLPTELFGKYEIKMGPNGDQRVLNEKVVLRGPADVMDGIKARLDLGENVIKASLELTPVELETGIESKVPVIKLPAGVELVSPNPLQPVQLTITPK